ncbi:MAG: DUF5652 family protein [Patescibacteria group bacterium]|nr:DUF5652 family protein [Patescibacteria group bacterium]
MERLSALEGGERGEQTMVFSFACINTVGILEILYLYVFSKKGKPVESSHHEEHHKVEK